MQAVIIGTGLMGTAVAYAMNKLGHEIHLVDSSRASAEEARAKIESLGGTVARIHTAVDLLFNDRQINDVGVAISCAPFSANQHIAMKCAENKWRYCDLGGNPDVSDKIAETAIRLREVSEDSPVFTDLGLAPGFANILAEHGYQIASKIDKPYAVLMRVGGLPSIVPRNALGYALTFNAAGLYNEYVGRCRIIDWGNLVSSEALTDRVDTFIPNVGDFEEFHTKGGAGKTIDLMHERDVQFCNYKTLRYPGHLYNVKFLLNECKLGSAEFSKAVENCCGWTTRDKVVLQVRVESKESYLRFKDSELRGWRRGVVIDHDENWTAMQKGTAFPTAAVASLMAEGKLDGKIVLDYSDVPLAEFKTKLEEIGGLPTKEIF
tara:strand:- start:10643 stop:11773 length:1131 start_codon:yes stop_codon:yes gene_type:complete